MGEELTFGSGNAKKSVHKLRQSMNTGLKEQLDQIADQTVSGNVSVIVQMDLGKDLRKFLQATSEAINLRRSVVSARALVPPPREKLMASNRGGSSR